MRIRNSRCGSTTNRNPLSCSGWALCLLPLVLKESLKVGHVPRNWRCCPCTFKATRDCVPTITGTETVLPAKPHLLKWRTLWLATNILRWVSCAMCLSKCMATCNQCNCLFIIHSHASKGFANVASREKWIRISIWTFRVDVDQSHLNCA